MNIVEEDILKKIVSHYRETGINSFDSSTFSSLENIAIKGLEDKGYISINPNILQTVSLTDEILSIISTK